VPHPTVFIIDALHTDIPKCDYVGMTTQQFKKRLAEHWDFPKRDVLTESAGEPFNKPGQVSNGQVLERVAALTPTL
jgi:hypothetical protein